MFSAIPVVLLGVAAATVPVDNRRIHAAVTEALADFRTNNPFPGAVVVVVYPAARHEVQVAVGASDLEARVSPMEITDRCLAGSVGKTFFAAAALAQAEDGKLDLDEPIETVSVKNHRPAGTSSPRACSSRTAPATRSTTPSSWAT